MTGIVFAEAISRDLLGPDSDVAEIAEAQASFKAALLAGYAQLTPERQATLDKITAEVSGIHEHSTVVRLTVPDSMMNDERAELIAQATQSEVDAVLVSTRTAALLMEDGVIIALRLADAPLAVTGIFTGGELDSLASVFAIAATKNKSRIIPA